MPRDRALASDTVRESDPLGDVGCMFSDSVTGSEPRCAPWPAIGDGGSQARVTRRGSGPPGGVGANATDATDARRELGDGGENGSEWRWPPPAALVGDVAIGAKAIGRKMDDPAWCWCTGEIGMLSIGDTIPVEPLFRCDGETRVEPLLRCVGDTIDKAIELRGEIKGVKSGVSAMACCCWC